MAAWLYVHVCKLQDTSMQTQTQHRDDNDEQHQNDKHYKTKVVQDKEHSAENAAWTVAVPSHKQVIPMAHEGTFFVNKPVLAQ